MIRRAWLPRAAERALRLVGLTSLLLASAQPVNAQLLRGILSDSASRRPIIGGVVSLLDSAGAPRRTRVTLDATVTVLPLILP